MFTDMRDFLCGLVVASVIPVAALAQQGNALAPSVYLSVPITQPYIALTFDDGPFSLPEPIL